MWGKWGQTSDSPVIPENKLLSDYKDLLVADFAYVLSANFFTVSRLADNMYLSLSNIA